jgi:uncharacterized protein (TIGR00269 family)
MLARSDQICIGLSGGKDSVALLHILARIEQKFPKSKIIAVTVREGISQYDEEALRYTKLNTKKLGIEHEVFSFKDLFGLNLDEIIESSQAKLGDNRMSACSYCGILRRKALNHAAIKMKSTKLAVAHNLDDEAQTFLMNILRGEVQRLARFPNKSNKTVVPRIKPLSEIPEREVVLYNHYRNLQYQTLECPYRHEAFRTNIREFLNRLEQNSPTVKYSVISSGRIMIPALRNHIEGKPLRVCISCGGPTTQQMCRPCKTLKDFGIKNSSNII